MGCRRRAHRRLALTSAEMWTSSEGDVRWFGPVPGSVLEVVQRSGPCTAVLASPPATSVISEEPTAGLEAVEAFERLSALSDAVLATVER